MDSEAHAQQLREQGYTVFERVYDAAWVDELRAEIVAHYESLGAPVPWSADSRELAEDVVVCMAGLTVRDVLTRLRHRAPSLLAPAVIACLRSLLGPEMYLEVAGWIISDKHRPFFDWHVHINGQDDSHHLRNGFWPQIGGVERVMTLLYLEDVDAAHGPMLIHPRTHADSPDPPHDTELDEWEGQVVLEIPRGSLLCVDQSTWHAVRRQEDEGLRIWLGLTYAAAQAPRSVWFDPSLIEYEGGGELLQSVLPRRVPPDPR